MDGLGRHCCFFISSSKKIQDASSKKIQKTTSTSQKNVQEKDNVFTLIRKLNTVAGSPKKWTRKRRRFYTDSETQHGRRVVKKKDNVFTLIRKLNTVVLSPKKWTR